MGCQDPMLSTSASNKPPSQLPASSQGGPQACPAPHPTPSALPGQESAASLGAAIPSPSVSRAGTPPAPRGCQQEAGRNGSLAHFLRRLRARFPRGETKVGASPRLLPRKAPAKPRRGRLRLLLARGGGFSPPPSPQAPPACPVSRLVLALAGCPGVSPSPGRGDEGPPHQGQCPLYPTIGGHWNTRPASHLSGPSLGHRCLSAP